jgi:hypothetical protein
MLSMVRPTDDDKKRFAEEESAVVADLRVVRVELAQRARDACRAGSIDEVQKSVQTIDLIERLLKT